MKYAKPNSLMRRIDAYFTARPDAGLSLSQACALFGCTGDQLYRAIEKANSVLGLGLGIEPFFRLGASRGATKARKRSRHQQQPPHAAPRPGAVASSIFSATHPPRIRIGAAAASDDTAQQSLTVIQRHEGGVTVRRITPQETPEWQERERQRRARQRPPAPAAKARSRGKKVRAWDGEATE